MVKVDKPLVIVQDQEQAELFLRSRGLFVGESVVGQAVLAFQKGKSKYSLSRGKYLDGRSRPGAASKNTIDKIFDKYQKGELAPYEDYLRTLAEKREILSADQERVWKQGDLVENLALPVDLGGNRSGDLNLLVKKQVKDALQHHYQDLRNEAEKRGALIRGHGPESISVQLVAKLTYPPSLTPPPPRLG